MSGANISDVKIKAISEFVFRMIKLINQYDSVLLPNNSKPSSGISGDLHKSQEDLKKEYQPLIDMYISFNRDRISQNVGSPAESANQMITAFLDYIFMYEIPMLDPNVKNRYLIELSNGSYVPYIKLFYTHKWFADLIRDPENTIVNFNQMFTDSMTYIKNEDDIEFLSIEFEFTDPQLAGQSDTRFQMTNSKKYIIGGNLYEIYSSILYNGGHYCVQCFYNNDIFEYDDANPVDIIKSSVFQFSGNFGTSFASFRKIGKAPSTKPVYLIDEDIFNFNCKGGDHNNPYKYCGHAVIDIGNKELSNLKFDYVPDYIISEKKVSEIIVESERYTAYTSQVIYNTKVLTGRHSYIREIPRPSLERYVGNKEMPIDCDSSKEIHIPDLGRSILSQREIKKGDVFYNNMIQTGVVDGVKVIDDNINIFKKWFDSNNSGFCLRYDILNPLINKYTCDVEFDEYNYNNGGQYAYLPGGDLDLYATGDTTIRTKISQVKKSEIVKINTINPNEYSIIINHHLIYLFHRMVLVAYESGNKIYTLNYKNNVIVASDFINPDCYWREGVIENVEALYYIGIV